MPPPSGKKKVTVITLGCSKNTVDSEVLLHQLDVSGMETAHDPENVKGGTVIINTCGFIRDAQEESVDMILRFAEARKRGDIDKLIVMGCLSQRFHDDLKREIPEVDYFFGVHHQKEIVRATGANFHYDLLTERFLTTPAHYAYVKISEGCSRHCAFCSIPAIRGKHISKPVEKILQEVKWLAARGVKEIMLIAQDLTWYGKDRYNEQKLPELLEKLSGIQGIRWIRLHYAYPASFPWKVISLMKEKDNICHYLDMPFQHITDHMLTMMRRDHSESLIRKMVYNLRHEIPDLSLRTTLLVGHPGETEKDFERLLAFVRETRFERLGVFTYSHEKGTYAWKHYKDDIPEKVKKMRASIIMKVQEEIATQQNRQKVGKTFTVLLDRAEGDFWVGRSAYDSPEVDQEILIPIRGNAKLKPGVFCQVEITRAADFDLFGNITQK